MHTHSFTLNEVVQCGTRKCFTSGSCTRRIWLHTVICETYAFLRLRTFILRTYGSVRGLATSFVPLMSTIYFAKVDSPFCLCHRAHPSRCKFNTGTTPRGNCRGSVHANSDKQVIRRTRKHSSI